ncbi:MAG: helix-turn-helix domain-containing protein [Elusimicrobia bacterium]|nr:helix-turn-helix domain-containing protein [Elusimicrobiota bacterium]
MKRKPYTTFDIAKMLHVYSGTVARWIDDGKITAYVTPGGHRRVNGKDLKKFLMEYNMPIPPEIVDNEEEKIPEPENSA